MLDYFNQVEQAIPARLYYLALAGALTIPDMCGAIESADGIATGPKYKAWFDQHVAPQYTAGGDPSFVGDDAWNLRCSLLHQGRTQHPKGNYSRILFVEPNPDLVHNNVVNDALNLDIGQFCRDVVTAARNWLPAARATQNFQRNYPLFMQRYANGFPPYVGGVPLIT